MNHMIKCKFGCEGGHPTTVCPKFAQAKALPAQAAKRVQEIAARPVAIGPKGRAKKAKAKKKSATKQAKRRQAAEPKAKVPAAVPDNSAPK